MTTHYQKSDPIILGSGELFISLAKDIVDPENLTTEEEAALINIGAIESGATIDIADEKIDIESANRGLIAKISTKKEIRFSTGIITWNISNISKYLLGSTFTENESTGEKKMIISDKDSSPTVYIRFVHEKKDGGQLICNIYKGVFDGELSLAFEGENPTTVNYEFVSLTNKNRNYVEFIETDATAV